MLWLAAQQAASPHTLLSCHGVCANVQAKVDRVLLVGGATRMPKVRQIMADYFGFQPDTAVDSDEAVMHGAAIEAARLTAPNSSADIGGVCARIPRPALCPAMPTCTALSCLLNVDVFLCARNCGMMWIRLRSWNLPINEAVSTRIRCGHCLT